MSSRKKRFLAWTARNASFLLFAMVVVVFGWLSPKFLQPTNLVNIFVQSSSTAVVAIGMTFVLLTAGVDLSVGAIMFVSAALAGKLALAGAPLGVVLAAILLAGLACGAINAFLITRLRIAAFVVTLATLYVGRGFALWVTQTRAMNLPETFLALGTTRLAGIPVPVWLLVIILAVAHFVLTRTPFGRQIYAVGSNQEMAGKAGLRTYRLLASVYVISGFCAAAGSIISLAQLGAVSPTFGNQKEFAAIAAAVLGGTSLFGGRGQVFPGTLLGALLMQTVENGLVILNTDPYLYPLVTGAIIFIAVLVDCLRTRWLLNVSRRPIRMETSHA